MHRTTLNVKFHVILGYSTDERWGKTNGSQPFRITYIYKKKLVRIL